MSARLLIVGVAVLVVLMVVAGTCDSCDTAARHFLRELFRAVL